MEKSLLKQILIDGKNEFFWSSSEIRREINFEEQLQVQEVAYIILGVRRCGKSTLLRQIAKKIALNEKYIFYLNFEDPRLINFSFDDFQKTYEIFIQEIEQENNQLYFFYDEVQNIPGWERWIQHLAKNKRNKVFVTGSNSRILSSELATYLTGRTLQLELMPLSFKEILKYYLGDINIEKIPSEEIIQIKKFQTNYLTYGSFPRAFLDKSTELLKQYFSDILLRDIAARRQIRRPEILQTLGQFLCVQNTNYFNKTRSLELFGINDQTTLGKYCNAFKDAFLFYELRGFSPSLRKRQRSLPKFYAIDPIMAHHNQFSISENSGVILENYVYLELRRRYQNIFYWKSKNDYEVDFLVVDGNISAYQVCFSMENKKTLDREIRSLLAVKEELKVKELFIITFEEEKEINVEGTLIKVLPFYKWAMMMAISK